MMESQFVCVEVRAGTSSSSGRNSVLGLLRIRSLEVAQGAAVLGLGLLRRGTGWQDTVAQIHSTRRGVPVLRSVAGLLAFPMRPFWLTAASVRLLRLQLARGSRRVKA